jgi:hypothetical protein
LDCKSVTKRKPVDSEFENVTSPGLGNLEEQQQNHPANIKQRNTVQGDIHVGPSSARPKKLPVIKNSDLLWEK